jgi:putative MFS transporter
LGEQQKITVVEAVNGFPSKFIALVLIIAGIGFMWDLGFDAYIVGATVPTISKQFAISTATASLMVSLGTAGMGVGAILAGYMSDILGRRRLFLITMAIISIGSFLVALATSYAWILVWRTVMGFGIGAEVPVIASYVNEMVPGKRRGRLYSLANASAVFGTVIVSFLGAYLIPTYTYGWRLLYIIGALGAVVFLIMRFAYMPESPRWLLKKGRFSDAEEVIRKIYDKYLGGGAKGFQLDRSVPPESRFSYRMLFSSDVVRRTVLMALWWILLIFAFWSVEAYLPTYLVKEGYSIASSLVFTAVASIAALVFYPIAAYFADRYERKHMLAFLLIANTILAMGFGFSRTVAGILIFGFLIWGSLDMFAWYAHMYTNEMFPTSARSSGDGLAEGVGRIAGLWTLTIIPTYILPLPNGVLIAFSLIAVVLLVMAGMIMLGPKVTKRELEEIEAPKTQEIEVPKAPR